jgi:hypothetical protein
MPKSPRTYAVEPEQAVDILLDSGIKASLQALVDGSRKARTLDFLQSYFAVTARMRHGSWSFFSIDAQPTSADWLTAMSPSRWKKAVEAMGSLPGVRALLEARSPKSEGWDVYLITASDRGAIERTHLCKLSR